VAALGWLINVGFAASEAQVISLGFYKAETVVPANDPNSGAGFYNTAVDPPNDTTTGVGFFNDT